MEKLWQDRLPEAGSRIYRLGPLRLRLIDGDYAQQRRFDAGQTRALMEAPPMWVLCWPGGVVLAEELSRQADRCRRMKVLDFGCGCGVAGLMAAYLGARVTFCDRDPEALASARHQVELNGLTANYCGEFEHLTEDFDLALLADVLYDPDNHGWLERVRQRARRVLVADSKVHSLPGYSRLRIVEAQAIPDCDPHREFGRVALFDLTGEGVALECSNSRACQD